MNDSFCKQSMYLLWSEGKEGVFFTVKKGLCFTSIHHSYFSRNEQGKNKDLLHTTLSCSCNSQAAKFMAYIELKCVFIRFQPVKNKINPTVLNFTEIHTYPSFCCHLQYKFQDSKLFCFDTFDSLLGALPKQPTNQIKPVQQSRQQMLRTYCAYTYILGILVSLKYRYVMHFYVIQLM